MEMNEEHLSTSCTYNKIKQGYLLFQRFPTTVLHICIVLATNKTCTFSQYLHTLYGIMSELHVHVRCGSSHVKGEWHSCVPYVCLSRLVQQINMMEFLLPIHSRMKRNWYPRFPNIMVECYFVLCQLLSPCSIEQKF